MLVVVVQPTDISRELLINPKVTARIQVLQEQRDRTRELTRDSLTIKSLDVADEAQQNGKFSASISGLRLAGDLQGLTTSNPVAEATQRFLAFLAGEGGKPAVVGDVVVLESAPSSADS